MSAYGHDLAAGLRRSLRGQVPERALDRVAEATGTRDHHPSWI